MATSEPDFAARVDDLVGSAWVLAALASAAGGGDLTEEHGALLGAAGYAERAPGGWRLRPAYRRAADHPEAHTLPRRIAAVLREAADAAEGIGEEDNDDILVAEGMSSGADMAGFLDLLATRVPGFGDLVKQDGLRFLDVGTGIGAVAAAVIGRAAADARATGLDIRPSTLELAADHLSSLGVRDRVDLREQNVAELAETDVYDLAWLPLAAIAPKAAAAALPRLRTALRPGGLLISSTVLRGARQAPAVREAAIRWRMARKNITPWSAVEAVEQLTAAGFCDVQEIETPARTTALVIACAPE
ncbi:MAG: methyltransferase domain-containing protein [Nocardiopsaceae bacterium]|nr:methyltransferase domain-containing protein [Nocardiopsaceae bacterium]